MNTNHFTTFYYLHYKHKFNRKNASLISHLLANEKLPKKRLLPFTQQLFIIYTEKNPDVNNVTDRNMEFLFRQSETEEETKRKRKTEM